MLDTQPSRWPADRAWAWYRAQPWLVGCNFLPSTAINQLEMFQPAEYDANRPVLARELDWAAGLGINTLRVFLHDLLWSTDAPGFFRRLDDFLDLCAARRIRPMLIFFDACHQPEPRVGRQPAPTPGIHNPGWAQSPSVSTLADESRWGSLERYVTEVLSRHAADDRILCWDLYNEPCNAGFDGNRTKAAASARLVTTVFEWARAVSPAQPLTVCTWGDPHPLANPDESTLDDWQIHVLHAQRDALRLSDIVSFHHYGPADDLATSITTLQALGRPILCTEYMARSMGSRFESCLPVLREMGVAAYHWGFVSGKSQTIFPWRSPEGAPEPDPWFHDLLRPDGSPYDPAETALIRSFTGIGPPPQSHFQGS